MQSITAWLAIYLRGMAIGLAELIPGISGGTIALLAGIYPRMLGAISRIDLAWLRLLVKLPQTKAFKEAAERVDAWFMVALTAGMMTMVFTAADFVRWLLEEHKLLLWAFFFGLLLSAACVLAKQAGWIKNPFVLISVLVTGLIMGFGLPRLGLASIEPTPLVIILAGGIAGCVWILPGLSGSFVLLVMGMYQHVIVAVADRNIGFLLLFAAGMAAGLPLFCRGLSRLLERHRQATSWFLIAFIIGSLHQIWPWQETLSYYYRPDGDAIVVSTKAVLPSTWVQTTTEDPMTVSAILLMALGVGLVLLTERRWTHSFQ